MKSVRSIVILGVFCLAAMLSGGCATTGTTAGADAPGEAYPEIKITEFILGVGDKVDIAVYRQDDLKSTKQVNSAGNITFPMIGDIKANGMSIYKLRDVIRDGLSKYINDPQVSVEVSSVQSQKYTVVGEVKGPGLFTLESPVTAVEAIGKAGGFTIDAKGKSVLLIRKGAQKNELVTLNISNVLKHKGTSQDVYLQNGDIIYVPQTALSSLSRVADYISRIITPITQIESGVFIGQQISTSASGGVSVPTR